jgi:hypothetical protein
MKIPDQYTDNPLHPRYPIFIPTKTRWEKRLTMRSLDSMGVHYFAIVEHHQVSDYVNHGVPRDRIVVLDPEYQRQYDTFDEHGLTKSVGPGAARNFAWDLSISMGYKMHWVMDDNILDFLRYQRDFRIRCRAPGLLRSCEAFHERYDNLGMSGPQYKMFCMPYQYRPPFVMNTRIYSCNLIRNDLDLRWRGRYNEDTDLSLRMLKAGWCTVQFNHALQDKLVTQALRGGNSAEFYDNEGTKPKSIMLEKMHPDVAKVKWKYGRWHHEVNYRPWRKMLLKPKFDLLRLPKCDEFGMKLVPIDQEAHKLELRDPANWREYIKKNPAEAGISGSARLPKENGLV